MSNLLKYANRFTQYVKCYVKSLLKGAVCKLSLLKHKITIICLQILKKHAKLTYMFIWKTMLQSVILLWKCAFRAGTSVFVMVCVTLPLPVYPIVFPHPGLPVGGKYSAFHLIHHHVRSFLLVSLIWHPARASSLRRSGRVKKNVSNILNLDCNKLKSILHTAPLMQQKWFM